MYVAVAYYLLMLGGGIVALVAIRLPLAGQWILFVTWYVFLALMGLRVDRQWRQFTLTQGNDAN
jgi:hypothetical protein